MITVPVLIPYNYQIPTKRLRSYASVLPVPSVRDCVINATYIHKHQQIHIN